MSVLIQMCFIHVVGGYVNVAQIAEVVQSDSTNHTYVITTTLGRTPIPTGDTSSEAFLRRIEETCGGKHE